MSKEEDVEMSRGPAGAGAGKETVEQEVVRPLGSVTVPGPTGTLVRRSARLMTKAEIERILSPETEASQDDLVEASLSDAIAALHLGSMMGGVKRRGRADTPTGPIAAPEEALEQPTPENVARLVKELDEPSETLKAVKRAAAETGAIASGVVGTLDNAAATVIGWIPTAIKTVLGGAATSFVINNPTLFAQIAGLLREGLTAAIDVNTLAGWGDYKEAARALLTEIGLTAETIAALGPGSPWFVITSALFVMKYRAGKQGKTVKELIADDAQRLKAATLQAGGSLVDAAKGQIAAFVQAYDTEKDAKALAALKEVAEKVRTDRPKGAGTLETSLAIISGAPAVRSGPEGSEGAAVPAYQPKSAKGALARLTGLPAPTPPPAPAAPPEEAAAAEALLAMASGPAPMELEEEKAGGRRKPRRKTYRKKKAPRKTRARASRASRASRKFIY